MARAKFVLATGLGMLLLLSGTSVFAKKTLGDAPSVLDKVTTPTGIEKTDVQSMSGTVIKVALSTIGIMFFILVVYAGIKWMTARGEEDQVTKARDTIITATIGLVIIIGAYAATSFVQTRILEGASGNPLSSTDTVGEEQLLCCIVPATANDLVGVAGSGGVHAARMDTAAGCKAKSEGGVQGTDWDTYDVPDFTYCEKIFACWDTANGSQGSNFNSCIDATAPLVQ